MSTAPHPAPSSSGTSGTPDPVMPDMPDDAERTRGRYLYTRDGAAVGVDERFVLGSIAPSVVRVRSTRVTASPTARLEADVRFAAGSVTAAVRWVGSDVSVVRAATADLAGHDGVVESSRVVDEVRHESAAVAGILYPLMRVFTGPLVRASALEGGLRVVVPDVADPTDAMRFLAPTVSERTAEVLGERGVVVDGIERVGTAYRWIGGAYGDDGADFVVDDGGLLLAYAVTQPSGRWEISLADVTGPWPVPSSWPGSS